MLISIYIFEGKCVITKQCIAQKQESVVNLVILIGFSNTHNYQQFIIKTYTYS